MADRFDFISTTDKPALLAITTPEWHTAAQAALVESGYKVHRIASHLEFPGRFSQGQYQIVVVEDQFGGTSLAENMTLQMLQTMPMNQRRHASVILLGNSYETLNPLEAFQMSVHAVINYSEMGLFEQLVQKVVSDNDLFLHNFRDAEKRIAQTKK